MIITVTLNPALDKTIYIEDFEKSRVNKATHCVVDPGGKGINVSKVLRNLNHESVAMGFIGGKQGQRMCEILEAMKVETIFTPVQGETRMNIKIIDTLTGDTTDINERGEEIKREELDEFMFRFKSVIEKADYVVLSGSTPEGIPRDIYGALSKLCKETGTRVCLDASGDLLREALDYREDNEPSGGLQTFGDCPRDREKLAKRVSCGYREDNEPSGGLQTFGDCSRDREKLAKRVSCGSNIFLIKPNIEELQEALGKKLESQEEVVGECRKLLDKGMEYICLSMGSEGAMLIGKEFLLRASVPKVTVKSTVGAGDSLLGAMVSSLDQGNGIEEAFKMGMAASVAAVTLEGTKAPTFSQIHSRMDQIHILKEEIR